MNHPLPKHELNSVEDSAESAVGNTPPTWLSQNYRDDDAEFLVNQYRRKHEEALASPAPESRTYEYYRRRIMEKQREQTDFQLDRQPMAPMPPLPTIPASELEVQHRYYGSEMAEQPRVAPSYARGPKVKKSLLFAGLFAAVAGGTVGLAVTKYDDISQTTSAALGYASSLLSSDSDTLFTAKRETSISKKPIAIASLDVSDVTGTLNSMIPLALNAEPAFLDQKLAIKISGLPASAYLSAGKKLPDNSWLLKDGEENGINLFVSQSDKSKFDISVAAIETNTGELAAPVKEITVAIDDAGVANDAGLAADASLAEESALQITPASAPPETGSTIQIKSAEAIADPVAEAIADPEAAAPATKSFAPAKPALTGEMTGLLQKGDMLMKTGDLIIARQFYSRAFQLGAADGAMGVAKTYDPATFVELKVQGITPDAAKAAEWYEKAKAAGVTDADEALTSLTASAQ
jgi:hypothetical protein